MKNTIEQYYFTIIYFTILLIFSISITDMFTNRVLIYLILSIVIILSTLVVESKINQSHNLQEKAKIMLFSMVPINLIVITIFWIFVF
ncbi:hypothetical protein I0622_002243 [Staphylococcus pseudintermedius]|uniref:Uncharacterized protein n=2 Tax=Staphylococcus intermedius group TaxID=2815305 RepID=A0A2P5JB34_STAPS|nr:hypothetical protein A9I66_04910 [Staphylococcus pseudintermedius]NBK47608.1 hypothetical protein [Staphylococcus delphini]ANQ87952.1 hypothetical protein A9I65_04600 [Staphylococcus pseudintermedius]ASQ50246.1 hypothetical protein SPS5912_04490 [Staphylococcus pseudintermedius]AYG56232.1 hypothetical protein D8L98_07360 [Staphylococcus pseudintermedius]